LTVSGEHKERFHSWLNWPPREEKWSGKPNEPQKESGTREKKRVRGKIQNIIEENWTKCEENLIG
jgi:hypothetical protein